jgi:hypothetical protein
MNAQEKETQRVIQFTTSCPSCSEPVDVVLDQVLVEALVKTFTLEKSDASLFIENVLSNRSGIRYHIASSSPRSH